MSASNELPERPPLVAKVQRVRIEVLAEFSIRSVERGKVIGERHYRKGEFYQIDRDGFDCQYWLERGWVRIVPDERAA
jgi:hypothetical protein